MSSNPHLSKIKRQFFIFSLFFLSFTLLKSARFPNLWSATQSSWNYDIGFVKRGLFGEILTFVLPQITYESFFYIAYSIYVLEVLAIIYIGYRMIVKHGSFSLPLSLILLSPGFVFHTHLVGYLDHVIVFMALFIAVIPKKYFLSPITPAICVASMLVHEIWLIMSIPVLIFRSLMLTDIKPKWKLIFPFISCVINLSLAIWLTDQTLEPQIYENFLRHVQEQTDFPLRYDNFEVLRRNIHANATLNILYSPNLLQTLKDTFLLNGLIYFPVVILFVVYIVYFLTINKGINYSWSRKMFLAAGVFLLAITPTATILLAWDYPRFFALSTILSFILFCIVLNERKSLSTPAPHSIQILCLIVVFLSFATYPTLFDGYNSATFPFLQRFDEIKSITEGSATFFNVPAH